MCRALAFAPLYNEDTATSPEHLVLLFWGGSSPAHSQDVLFFEGAVLLVGVDRKRGPKKSEWREKREDPCNISNSRPAFRSVRLMMRSTLETRMQVRSHGHTEYRHMLVDLEMGSSSSHESIPCKRSRAENELRRLKPISNPWFWQLITLLHAGN